VRTSSGVIASVATGIALLVTSTSAASAAVTNGQIAFQSTRSGDVALWLANADGTDPYQLPNAPSEAQGPSWSPDGTQIAFSAPVDGRGSAIWVIGADGSNPHVVADTPSYDIAPAWSPDGSQISFVADIGPYVPDTEVFLAAADGSGYRQFTNSPVASSATWSPEGSALAFVRDTSLIVAPLTGDGSGSAIVTFKKGTILTSPDWSPDGSTFVYLRGDIRSDTYDVYTIAADGSAGQRLTNDKLPDGDPAWSADGASILWSKFVKQDGRIWRMDANGAHKTAITDPGSGNYDASPDQQAVAS